MSGWTAVLTGSSRHSAIAAAGEVARRMSDPERVREAVVAARTQTHFPRTVHWQHHTVAQGDAGLALMYGHLDRCWPDAGWDVTAHAYMASAVRSAEGQTLPPGAFSGLGGLGLVARLLGRDGARYTRLAAAIEAELVPQAVVLAESVRDQAGGLPVSGFDAISGLSGVGACLLAHRDRPPMASACKRVLEALVGLVSGPQEAVPRWFTPHELIADRMTAARYPHGSLNCGLAHGIPGPLALMALALSEGAEVEGLRDATTDAAAWIVAHRCDDEWGVNWPAMVTMPESSIVQDEPSRAAWCYGSPGVARALWLAGQALDDASLTALAIDAMEGVYRRPVPVRQIGSPTFCHGVAGLLQITLRFWHDTGLDVFARSATDLVGQLVDRYEPDDAPLGFRHIEHGGNLIDQPGLLDGAPGVALVLLAAGTDVEPAWDRLFLLS